MAWNQLGWKAQFFSEVDRFPSAVLDYRHPGIPNLGDMTKFKQWGDYETDVIVGGTPCQSYSIAGLRKGLDDPRGNLMLTYLAIANRYRPRWVVWENVPGVLSSNKGRDFGTFLGALVKLGYGFSYRVLDAQYFGVPQRRRRVFVVGYLGDWRRAAAVLFERHSLQGNTAPSREKREDVANTITRGFGEQSGQDIVNGLQVVLPSRETANTLKAKGNDDHREDSGTYVVHGTQDPCVSDIAHALGRNNGGENCLAYSMVTANTNANGLGVSTEVSPTLDRAQPAAVAFAQNTRDEVREMPVVGALSTNPGMKQTSYIRKGMQVRRLTPIECERLQGFPDNFTQIPWRGKPAEECPSGHRYKALGNSMAVPVMRWIGERIEMVENVVAKHKKMK